MKQLAGLLPKYLKLLVLLTLTVGTLITIIGCTANLPKPLVYNPASQSILISNVTIVDVESEILLHNKDVYIENGVINTIFNHQKRTYNPNTQIVNANGKYLIPALWDMHTHTVSSSPQFHFPLYVANGVLNIRDMGDTCSWASELSCQPITELWRSELANGSMLGPNILSVASYHIEETSDEENVSQEQQITKAKALIQALKARNDETIKIQLGHNVTDDLFATILAESQQFELPVIGHLPGNLNLLQHDLRNLKSIEHDRALYPYCSRFSGRFEERLSTVNYFLTEFDLNKCKTYIRKLANNGVSYAPTHTASSFQELLIFNNDTNNTPGLEYVDKVTKSLWSAYGLVSRVGFSEEDGISLKKAHEISLTITKLANDQSVSILAGSDALDAFSVPGFSLHTELELLVKSGLTPYQALKAATLNPARYFNLQDSQGTVSEGKVANLVLLNNNPIANIKNTVNIESVIFKGLLYDEKALDDMKAYVLSNVNSVKSSSVLFWNLLSD